jgi:hypothetical protein
MRSVWIALALIVAGSSLGALLLWRVVDRGDHPKPLLAPRGARVLEERSTGASTIVTWRIGGHAEEPSSGLYGVTIWLGRRRLYEHRAAPKTSGIHVETGDFSRDGRPDVLLVDESGDCAFYRALLAGPTSVRRVLVRRLCGRRGSIQIRRRGLVIHRGQRAVIVWTIES